MKMVLFANQEVTIFNLHYDSLTEEETWLPTLLDKVNLTITKGQNISKSGIENADAAKLFIDVRNRSGKTYVPAKEFEELTLAEKKTHFTFTSEKDFFVRGNKTSIQPTSSGFFEWMLKHHDNVFKVTTIDEYKNVMPHLEIGGK